MRPGAAYIGAYSFRVLADNDKAADTLPGS
jgi:hypothetical protein